MTMMNREPQPSDGPDYHAEHQAWKERQPEGIVTIDSPSVKEQAERAQQEIRERWEAEGKNGPLTILPGQGDLLSEQAPIEIPEHWTFKDRSVAEGFDRHVREQLPWYDLVTDAIVQIGRHFIGEGGLVYDIGASTGNIGRALDATIQDRHASLVAVEESEQMADRWWGPGSLVVEPIQDHCKDMHDYDFAVLNLVLMFLRADEQAQVLDCLQKHIKPGGALVLVERMIPPAGYLSIVNSRLTLAAKLKAGVPAEDIVTKELSIAGSQRPIEASVLLAHGAVEWFRYGDFAGWIITRETPRYSR